MTFSNQSIMDSEFTHWVTSADDQQIVITETRGAFLDISKSFDKVWDAGLIYKSKSTGVSGDSLKLINNFLNNRFHRV